MEPHYDDFDWDFLSGSGVSPYTDLAQEPSEPPPEVSSADEALVIVLGGLSALTPLYRCVNIVWCRAFMTRGSMSLIQNCSTGAVGQPWAGTQRFSPPENVPSHPPEMRASSPGRAAWAGV
jgi:hypothetical protein